ncbi:MAG: response regulator [Elusimicrobia bacterium]|nr:response regulator [Elusimicrobiota bacterium]
MLNNQVVKLLILHENRDMHGLFMQLLNDSQFALQGVDDPHKALEILKNEELDLVFLDMHLSGVDPFEVIRQMLQIRPHVKIIMLSGYDDSMLKAKALQLGAFDYVKKPFQPGTVLRVIERALNKTFVERSSTAPYDIDDRSLFESIFSERILDQDRRSMIYTIVFAAITVGLIVSGLVGFHYHRKDQAYPTPYENPTALAWDGDRLWVSDWVTQSFYEHDPQQSFAVTRVVYLQGSHPTGLTVDRDSVWSCNAWEQTIYRHKKDENLTVVDQYPSPGPYPSGLYHDGYHLWVCDSKSANIYKTFLNDGTLTILKTYPTPGLSPVGMFSDGEFFWTADAGTRCIYKHAFDDQLTVLEIFRPQVYENTKEKLTGMTWGTNNLWTCSEGSSRIYAHHQHNLIRHTNPH